MVDKYVPETLLARPSGAALQYRLWPGRIVHDISLRSGGSAPPFGLNSGQSPAAGAKATSAKEVSDMIRLAERLGYLWQRYVAWRDPRPFKRER
jgi:hypothetical protein